MSPAIIEYTDASSHTSDVRHSSVICHWCNLDNRWMDRWL